MSLPPLLLAAAIAFWGWQTGFWLPAAVAALLLEAPRLSSRRWAFGLKDLNRFCDFSIALAAGIAVLFYFSYGNPRAVVLLFEWLPFALLPLALALAWGTHREVPLSVLFWALRRQPGDRPRGINAGYPYLAAWLLAASAANQRGIGFYAAACALLAWPLLLYRPRRAPLALPVAMLALAIALGYGAQRALSSAQAWMEGAVPDWITGTGSRSDPYRSTTDFGEVGRLKESDDIVMRVEMDAGIKPPLLLHRASYDLYSGGAWLARNSRFTVLEGGGPQWQLESAAPARRITIHDFAASGNPVLALPAGSTRVAGLKAVSLKRNPLGTVQAESPPGYVDYEADYGGGTAEAGPPAENDLRLPAAEEKMLREVAASAGLAGLAPAAAAQRLRDYFSSGFSYSLYQEARAPDRSPLADFLLVTHSGHCEYFATAAVLLARAAGVPARYATGFSAVEYSALEQAYVVRKRHAHAWARLYIDGRWQDLDATPPTWVVTEGMQARGWAPLFDFVSWGRFALSRWLADLPDTALYGGAAVVVAAGLLWLARGTLRGRGTRQQARGENALTVAGENTESPFHQVETRLAALGWPRAAARPALAWVESLADHAELEPEALRRLVRLHYRLRYDPLGLNARERKAFTQAAADWLARHPPAGAKPAQVPPVRAPHHVA